MMFESGAEKDADPAWRAGSERLNFPQGLAAILNP